MKLKKTFENSFPQLKQYKFKNIAENKIPKLNSFYG